MNLDDVVAQLLAGSLDEFTNARNAKAKELKAAAQKELADEVAGLKKPPVAVWAVNQLARRYASVLGRLRRAGEAVVQAQSGAVSGRKNAAPELRSASEALQRELEATVGEAGEVLRAGDHAADEATLRRVQEMLRLAAVSGGDTWDRLQRGALISEPRAGEDMLTAAFALGSAGSGGKAAPRGEAGEARGARTAGPGGADTAKRNGRGNRGRTPQTHEEAGQAAGGDPHPA